MSRLLDILAIKSSVISLKQAIDTLSSVQEVIGFMTLDHSVKGPLQLIHWMERGGTHLLEDVVKHIGGNSSNKKLLAK